ncbi:MAG: hypothetical protein ABR505_04350, partial [Actinomycetota bacterium]
PSGAPAAEEPQPPQGPVVPTQEEQQDAAGSAAPTSSSVATGSSAVAGGMPERTPSVREGERPPPEETEPVPPVPEPKPPPIEPVPPVPPQPDPTAQLPAEAPAIKGVDESEAEAVYERVLAEERARGASEPVAIARAKAARRAAIEGTELF